MNERAQDALRRAVGSALDVLLAGMPTNRTEESRRDFGGCGTATRASGRASPRMAVRCVVSG
jgi:hypothetical protein